MEGKSFEKQEGDRLGTLASGEIVTDRPNSHMHQANPAFKEYLKQTLSEIDAEDRAFFIYTKEFDEAIGSNYCIETGSDADELVTYAVRVGRKGFTRFVRNKKPETTNKLTVILRKKDDADGVFLLITAFEGPSAAREPWDAMAEQADKDFWKNHALVWDAKMFPFIPGTVRTSKPEEYSFD